MPQFAATIKHIKDGVKSFTVSAAVKNIEGWEATLETNEVSGVKGTRCLVEAGDFEMSSVGVTRCDVRDVEAACGTMGMPSKATSTGFAGDTR